MTPGEISWVGLLTLMVDGPDLPVRGVISSRDGDDTSRQYFGWAVIGGQPMPVFAGFASAVDAEPGAMPPDEPDPAEQEPVLIRVWRAGRRVRLERPDGRPSLIVGDSECWRFRGDDPVPVVAPSSAVVYQGNGTDLLDRREANSFVGNDFTRPTGPVGSTTFLGRPAYTVELAPPSHKPYPLQLVVDAETGLVLQQRNDGFGSVDEWVEIAVGEPLDDELFRWQGPSVPEAHDWPDPEREWHADQARRLEWFRANVAPLPLRLELDLGVFVHEHDPDGSFQASIGEDHLGMLARRPSSDAEWELRWDEVQHRWSAGGWDWALTWREGQLTEAGLASLKQALGRT
ncbi:hypothetical protein [Jatrophihabitans sp.]|uniref:hypothetical protein n=1 Tax=Jatrophihabitans sp. TaxID=1932789 RepID=UPI002BC7E261|nr:hypothetical protein [Jatrophihabitans sp.]